jgi:hypothetical protein
MAKSMTGTATATSAVHTGLVLSTSPGSFRASTTPWGLPLGTRNAGAASRVGEPLEGRVTSFPVLPGYVGGLRARHLATCGRRL